MKKGFFAIILIIFTFFIPASYSQDTTEKIENYNNLQYLELEMYISNDVGVEYTSSNHKVEYIKSDLSFFPKNDERQTVESIKPFSTPSGIIEEKENEITYLWNDFSGDTINYGYTAKVMVNNQISRIDKKIDFPVKKIDSNFLTYTQATEFIDINAKIEKKANEIIGVEDDFYKVVFKLAEWTNNNINYNLSTLTAEVVQPSSWVLEKKEGVCDEMTNLFISFLRSVGIPARFVSGMVYTNVGYEWGAHGWAEVYFPEYGWVPFDVTFAEFGWIDPSHLNLKDDVDSGSPTAKYAWKSNGAEIKVGTLDIKTNALTIGPEQPGAVELEVLPVKTVAKFGSHIPVEIKIKNINDYYIAPKIIVTKAPSLSEKNVKSVLLEPNEEKSLYWIAELPDADPAYVYTTTIETQSMYGEFDSATIKYGDKFEGYSNDWANAIVKGHEEREKKSVMNEVAVNCKPDKDVYYSGDAAEITCNFKNNENEKISFDLCFQEKCSKMTLSSGEKKTKAESFDVNEPIRIPIILESNDKVKYEYLNLEVIPVPEIMLSNPEPSEVDYEDDVEISFEVRSNTDVNDLRIEFEFGKLEYEFFEKDEVKTITVNTVGRQLLDDLKFEVKYKDRLGVEYIEQKAISINVNNIPWYGNFLNWINNLFD